MAAGPPRAPAQPLITGTSRADFPGTRAGIPHTSHSGVDQRKHRRSLPGMVVGCAVTPDGKWRVYLFDDHRAELADAKGRIRYGPAPIYRIADRLAELGYGGDDLVPE
jgi:hypothetical protein